MSCVGSLISTCTSITTDVETEERSMLQRCRYLRDHLKLFPYKSTEDTATTAPYVKISSKTLKECYVLPADGKCIEDVFERLAELMRYLKSQRTKPPRTDFTCLSRLTRNKVFIDVDCTACKRGEPAGQRRHFSFTKSLTLIMTTVSRIFNETVTEGVYMTTGGSTCGYHVFCNSLTYGHDGVTVPVLMDALEDAFKRAKMTNMAIDRGCTQMPLPTSNHSNSSRYSVPYVLKNDTEWRKERLNWVDMDADTLKCLSSIAFPNKYKNNIFCIEKPLIPPSPDEVGVNLEYEEDLSSIRKRKNSEEEKGDDTMKIDLPSAKKICLSHVVTSKIKPFNYTKPLTKEPPLPYQEVERPISESETGEGPAALMLEPPLLNPTPVMLEASGPQFEEENDVASIFSACTEATDAKSFMCPRIVPSISSIPVSLECKQELGRGRGLNNQNCRLRKRLSNDNGAKTSTLNNVLNSLPYKCENDKYSSFADKQYKAAILCAEEAEATASKARLELDNQEYQRIYVVPGSSSNVTREYKLLVQLVNVNRSIFGGDVAGRREWIDIQASYYDQHLRNPIILEIFKFLFGDKDIESLFDQPELEEIKRSVVHLMAPFKRRSDEETAQLPTMSYLLEGDERTEREARPHKSRIIGAMIRVCTHLFGMVTAVLSDLRKVQQTMERRDLSLLNRTVVNGRSGGIPSNGDTARHSNESDDDLDCSASMYGGCGTTADINNIKCATNYTLLASLIVHEETNLLDQALYAFLYYYHSFPSITIDRILDEVHHDGLMVTAMIKYFLMYDHGFKQLTLQDIFEGFNDAAIALSGPEKFIEMRKRNHKRGESKQKPQKNNNSGSTRSKKNNNPNSRRKSVREERDDSSDVGGTCDGGHDGGVSGAGITTEEVEKLLGGTERRRRRMMCNRFSASTIEAIGPTEGGLLYDWKDKHLWQAVINYYLRPVVMHEDRLVFANDGYDTFEDDAVESCVAHVMTKSKNTKADVMTAFKDARTVWRMHHGSQLVYESDLKSEKIGCCYHINIALKMYEMFCGGCVTRMKRVHKNYLIDLSRFNMSVYDVVAECRTASVNLTSAIDRSYMNLLLRQPVVPPFLEEAESRQLFMSKEELERGSFCCLSVMDYIRAMNLFERSNCQSRPELETCEYVEKFLDDMYTNEIAAEHPPDTAADGRMRLLYMFYSLYLYEVVFTMRHNYVKRENCYVTIERLCYELDVREILVLFFGESSMRRVEGLNEGLEHRIRQIAEGWDDVNCPSKNHQGDSVAENSSSVNGRFDVRPVLSVDIPDKMLRMKTLFGQFGFDVMQDSDGGRVNSATTTLERNVDGEVSIENSTDEDNCTGDSQADKNWEDESKFEQEFYANENWLETVCERIKDISITGKSSKRTPTISNGTSYESVFLRETVRSVMRLELKKHIDHDRLGKLNYAMRTKDRCNGVFTLMKHLPMRLKLLAFILTTHTFKLKTTKLAPDFVEETYRDADGRFEEERHSYEGNVNCDTGTDTSYNPPEKVWCRTTETLLSDRRSVLTHARWLAERRFKSSFFIGIDPEQVYSTLYQYMEDNKDRYPAFKMYNDNEKTRTATLNLCTAMMFILIMSAYDQEHVDLYLKVFLAVEWPGQWAKTIFVWKSNSNAGKSYLFDSIIKRACANSTCINDPKGGKENAPEKAEYVRNFVLFANEFSQANSTELKKLVSESTFKFRMNYGNVMNEAYATGKIMFNCNTLPPTSDEAAINRLTLFNIPFWFCKRQRISDAMLNWICGLSVTNRTRWEMAYRYELPSLLVEAEKKFFENHDDTKNETDLFDEYAAVRPNLFSTEFNKAMSSMFLVQNKTSRLYASCMPPTDRIVHGLINITNHFSWLRFFKRLDTPVDFSTLPASSEAVRSEWLSLTLPYQEWKQLTGAKADPSSRVSAETINRSLQAFSTKKNINYFGIRQFFETDFASSREAIKDEYYMRFDSKAFGD